MKKIMTGIKTMVALTVIAALFATNVKAHGEDLFDVDAPGCKYTGIVDDYCSLSNVNVLKCVNNKKTSNCTY